MTADDEAKTGAGCRRLANVCNVYRDASISKRSRLALRLRKLDVHS